MKKLIIGMALLTSASAFAQSRTIFPQIFNFGNSVQVQIYNPNARAHHCSGSITLFTMPYGSEYQYFSEYIRPQSSLTRTIWLRNFNLRIMNASHSIFCREI